MLREVPLMFLLHSDSTQQNMTVRSITTAVSHGDLPIAGRVRSNLSSPFSRSAIEGASPNMRCMLRTAASCLLMLARLLVR